MKMMEKRGIVAGVALAALLAGQAGAWTLAAPVRVAAVGPLALVAAEGEVEFDPTGGAEVDPAEPEVVVDEVLVDPAPEGDEDGLDDPQVDPVPLEDDGVMWIGGSPDFCEACTSTGIEDEPGTEMMDGEGDDLSSGGVEEDPVMMEDTGATPEEIRDVISTTAMPGGATAERKTNGSAGRCGDSPLTMYCPD